MATVSHGAPVAHGASVASLVGASVASAPTTIGRLVPAASAPVAEDDPAWDCETMGNMQCGPVSVTAVGTTDEGIAITLDTGDTVVIAWEVVEDCQPGKHGNPVVPLAAVCDHLQGK